MSLSDASLAGPGVPLHWIPAGLDIPRLRRAIEATKIYREFHHVGLKDAKDIIDAMERNVVLPSR